MRVFIATLIVCSIAVPSLADDKPRSAGARIGWTLAGAGMGFGLGMYVGFQKFDQARYAERKITTTAVSFAAAGGLIAFLLTRHKAGKMASPDRTGRQPDRSDAITSLSSSTHSVGSMAAGSR